MGYRGVAEVLGMAGMVGVDCPPFRSGSGRSSRSGRRCSPRLRSSSKRLCPQYSPE